MLFLVGFYMGFIWLPFGLYSVSIWILCRFDLGFLSYLCWVILGSHFSFYFVGFDLCFIWVFIWVRFGPRLAYIWVLSGFYLFSIWLLFGFYVRCVLGFIAVHVGLDVGFYLSFKWFLCWVVCWFLVRTYVGFMWVLCWFYLGSMCVLYRSYVGVIWVLLGSSWLLVGF